MPWRFSESRVRERTPISANDVMGFSARRPGPTIWMRATHAGSLSGDGRAFLMTPRIAGERVRQEAVVRFDFTHGTRATAAHALCYRSGASNSTGPRRRR